MNTLKINYQVNSSELCEIGKLYDTRYCHPYTLFYDSLFQRKRNNNLKIAELGIFDEASLLMWRKYFSNGQIFGFEYNTTVIERFRENYDNDRITLAHIDVTNQESIQKAFSEMNILYDVIIETTAHQFEDQIRVIQNVYQYIKPGGVLIIEDIFKSYDENEYINRLSSILHNFQDYYFIELDHINRNSTNSNTDKLFILVKGGAEPIFKNTNKITIITPSYRVQNLLEIKKSINFDFVDEWIIVYDGKKIIENPNLFQDEENNKIKEYVFTDKGISGNPQRNYALTMVSNPDTILYYLDDDNSIHPSLYTLLKIIDKTKMYTFNQENGLKGNTISVNNIDTAMFIIPYTLCKYIKWIPDLYCADGYYISECYELNKNVHIYVDNNLCYYNTIHI